METIELADGGILLYDGLFLPSDLADDYFAKLRDQYVWEQKPGIFGHLQPRLSASYGDPGISYRYSDVVNVALPWTSTLLEIKRKIEAVQGEYNYCLLTRIIDSCQRRLLKLVFDKKLLHSNNAEATLDRAWRK